MKTRKSTLSAVASISLTLVLAGCSTATMSMEDEPKALDHYPELAAKDGYFVSGDEASLRGGVGNYVPRPTGHDRVQRDRLARISTFSDLQRDQNDYLTVRLNREFLFDVGSAEVKPAAKEELRAFSAYLRDANYNYADLRGFADSTGAADMNEELSARRAESIRRELTEGGLDPATLQTTAYGENYPVSTNATPSGRAKNRRVEVVVIK